MCFYERLKKARQKRGLTSKEMAKVIGVAPSSYSQYENGKREPNVLKIKAITKALNISADYLLFGVDDKDETHIPYDSLNALGKQRADEYIKDLLYNPKYTADDEQSKE